MHIAARGETIASLFRRPSPSLAVRCRRCQLRTPIDLTRHEAHERDPREVVRLPVVCRCGTNDLDWVVLDASEVETFLTRSATARAQD